MFRLTLLTTSSRRIPRLDTFTFGNPIFTSRLLNSHSRSFICAHVRCAILDNYTSIITSDHRTDHCTDHYTDHCTYNPNHSDAYTDILPNHFDLARVNVGTSINLCLGGRDGSVGQYDGPLQVGGPVESFSWPRGRLDGPSEHGDHGVGNNQHDCRVLR